MDQQCPNAGDPRSLEGPEYRILQQTRANSLPLKRSVGGEARPRIMTGTGAGIFRLMRPGAGSWVVAPTARL